MSFSIKKTTITLTRGDTLKAKIDLADQHGDPYVFNDGDSLRFAMKKDYSDETTLILREVPTDTLILTLNPIDTKRLDFGEYVYDIQLTKANGEVDTFIAKGILRLTEEVE